VGLKIGGMASKTMGWEGGKDGAVEVGMGTRVAGLANGLG